MSRAKLLLLTMTAVLLVAGVSASTASAKISFEWFILGTLLKEKETRAFLASADGKNFDFHTSFDGINFLFLSKEIEAEGGVIIGGRPGTNEETIVFKGVTVDSPANCTLESLPNPVPGTVRTHLLKTEIVEGENGEVLILFTPKGAGEPFTTLLFLGASCAFANIPGALAGSFLGLPLPQRTEVLRQNLVFEPVAGNRFLLISGALDIAGITFAGVPFTFTGLTLIFLESDEPFGPF